MKRPTRTQLRLTTQHAANALHLLVVEGRITLKDVTAALGRREQMIRELREKLASIEGAVLHEKPIATRAARRKAVRKGKRRISAAGRASLQLQGKYMGTVHRLPAAARAKIKRIKDKSGIRAAIAAARKLSR